MAVTSAKRKRDELNINDLAFRIDYERLSSKIESGSFHFGNTTSFYRSSLLIYFFTHDPNLRTILIDYDTKIGLKLDKYISAIKKNPNVISLKFNLIRTKKFNQKILDIFSDDDAITSLSISDPKFQQKDLDTFCFNFTTKNSFHHTIFDNLYYQIQYFDAFSQILKHCSLLTSLVLSRIRFPQKLSTFAQALQDNKTLTSLTLESNIFDSSLSLLIRVLSTHQYLTTINLRQNNTQMIFPKLISDLITKNTTCTSLDISKNSFIDASFNLIFKSLQINKTIKSFKCSENSYHEPISTFQLSKVISLNTTLKTLCLDGNKLSADQPKLLFQAFRRNTTLTHLDLSLTGHLLAQNPALLRSILSNPSLQTFVSRINGLRQNSIAVISAALQTNTSLTSLNLEGNDIGAEYEKLFDALAVNTTLVDLDISSNYIPFSNPQKNYNLLVQNSTLKNLNIKNNNYTPELAPMLLHALERNFTLTHLKVELTIYSSAANRLLYAPTIKKNLTLYELLLHHAL